MAKCGAGIVCVLAAAAALGAQGSNILDLTHVVSSSGSMTAGQGGGSATAPSSHEKRQSADVRVRLESLDRDAYAVHDAFVFRMSLQNIGRQAITLPWEPDSSRVITGPDAPILTSVLVIDADTSGGRHSTVPVAMLYGSKLSPSSTKVLAPGDRAEIIAAAQWQFLPTASRAGAKDDQSGPAHITARLTFLTGIDGTVYNDFVSSNKLPIILTGKL